MRKIKLYTIIYVVLFVFATVQVLVEFAGFDYWTGLVAILALSAVKAVLVAGYYQHLVHEPRSLTALMVGSLFVALVLTTAAAFSIM
ncbi:cytochrome C oxidase subunit IV family protein [Halostella pelagica]|uniref:cytochrome C oxidase subunit IV family protein n=1 Tax=Halostella pelagica TaxID=2583824 RepID=UPI001080C0F5|nr:cytochrome C oxidase subunit IV family protein [Halostella pelagica]